ncbi:thyroid peroxidase isoform X1 [Sphaerodactylus townsendi]|uniref:thyroid peroxidase isoform X1 n=1 Tax=Sphaerodactylus townsendi TaxID=933632 RepID=UPI00202699DD|nr:thyroid peroxidase isoform X1 [Sphaerodactylus townsendi]
MRVFIFFIISITMASMAVFLSFVQKSRNDLFRKTRKHGITRTILEAASVTDEETYKIPERNLQRSRTMTPAQFLAFFKYPEQETQAVSRAAEKMEASIQVLKEKLHQKHKRSLFPSDLLSSDVLSKIASISGCLPHTLPPKCPRNCVTSKYRHITGICNNREHPRWGASNIALARWLPPVYEDGLSQPKGWNSDFLHNGFPLPSVHEVTRKIIEASNEAVTEDELHTDIFIVWGQYIDHDLAFTPQSTNQRSLPGEVDCEKTCENQNSCFPIQVFSNDTFSINMNCMPFYRSSPACATGHQGVLLGNLSTLNPRQQINGLTSFIDASTVYGSTPAIERKLRNMTSKEGLLRINLQYFDNGREYLPFVDRVPSPCAQNFKADEAERIECFMAGDSRLPARDLLFLHWVKSAISTFMVASSTIPLLSAKALKKLNPQWSSETIYQEARKIVGALHQIITIRDYIPKVIGPDAFNEYIGPYKGYSHTADPTVANVFSTAAFRFAHAAIHPVIKRLNTEYQNDPNLPNLNLHEVFFAPWRLIKEGGLDPLLRGMLATAAKLQVQDQLLNEELTRKLFVLSNNGSLDLASLDLQRGRDHGLPGYNEWREFCDLPRVTTETDLAIAIENKNVAKTIMELYGNPNNIDVWLGGIVENLLPGARTGPLFACIIGKQMKALREGDRFWWENSNVFTASQRNELSKYSLSRLICGNTNLTALPLDAFMLGKFPEDFKSCENIPNIDLGAWRETLQPEFTCGLPKRVENGEFVHCTEAGISKVTYSCYQGYKLQGEAQLSCTKKRWNMDLPVCQDINECENKTNPPCHTSARCVNTKGSFQCFCTDPYELTEDGLACTDSGRLPKSSVVAIILGIILCCCLAAASWFIICQWTNCTRSSTNLCIIPDGRNLSVEGHWKNCHETNASQSSITVKPADKDYHSPCVLL